MADTFHITNIVVTANLEQRVDVKQFNNYPWGLCDLEVYGGRCGYIKDKKTMPGKVVVFYERGTMNSLGAKTVKDGIKQLNTAMKLLVSAGLAKPVKLKPKVQNIVGVVDLKKPLDILKIARKVPHSIYEPENFPAVIHRTNIPCTLLIFSTGKIVVAGLKSEGDLPKVYELTKTFTNLG